MLRRVKHQSKTFIDFIDSTSPTARRAVFSYAVVILCMTGIMILGLTASSEVARTAVQSLEMIAMVAFTGYLGISAADRAGVLTSLADRLGGGGQNRGGGYPQRPPGGPNIPPSTYGPPPGPGGRSRDPLDNDDGR